MESCATDKFAWGRSAIATGGAGEAHLLRPSSPHRGASQCPPPHTPSLSLLAPQVAVAGKGASLPLGVEAGYEYIDRWSANTTWGGSAPPSGCGSWQRDKACVESVWIPAGQVPPCCPLLKSQPLLLSVPSLLLGPCPPHCGC